MTAVEELVYTPILTIVIFIISFLALSIVISKRSVGGLINKTSGKASLLYYVSTSPYATNIDAETAWANRVVYVSCDKANLTGSVSITLFDATTALDGTTLTIFNSPASIAPTRINVLWTGSAGYQKPDIPSITISLGTGQGVTLITERRIGSHYLTQNGGTDFTLPDLTPSVLQPRDWKVYRYYDPQSSMCSERNGVTSSTYTAIVDLNPLSPCGGQNIQNTGIGYSNYGATNCTSYICQCPNSQNIYPPPTSAFCNT